MKRNLSPFLLLTFALLLCSIPSVQAVTLPAIFGDHMVLQQKADVKIWGWAKPGEEVTVTPSWDNQSLKTKASNQAQWALTLQTPAVGGPYTITVKGYNTIRIEDVLLGEVWLCSGQSNMEWSARVGIDSAAQEIPKADYPSIRFFSVSHRTADAPQLDLNGHWVVCTPETMPDFSAVGYFFGKELHRQLNVPVGLINSSWGGTPAEIWVSNETISENPLLAASAARLPQEEWGPKDPGKAYNAMIAPLIPFRLAGALWYQGETNTVDPANYVRLLPALIQNWRGAWGYDFPFYYVQIAPYTYDADAGVALRDAQRRAMAVPNTGMAVISDIGNIQNIHPTNKHDVGKRLANWALSKTYGRKDVPVSGPLYRSMKVEGAKVQLYFDYADGLKAKGKALQDFEVAGPDMQFVKAEAKITGNTVVVQAKGVKRPVAVRYGWRNTALPELTNKSGLPASAFRTDDWPQSK
ncbi:sialate O-acetylesterase [Pontibacter liquoris]|uniref:sialate O-acetylesterase n=1 Tax=Pontibacter liquoris TaxID=2905677 RepID=UPI001FA79C43|nr:sialate O-acetylesterase [Pontibacter liquoris]